jgi:hypothetical protein
MGTGTATDAKRVFEALASHLSGKRMELRLAIEHQRGVEGWLQHEAVVALDNAHRGDLAGRLRSFWREGLRDERAATFDAASKRRPFDLVFDEPMMAACLKLYLPWKSASEAVQEIRADLIELRDHPAQGFLIAGRLDFKDGKTDTGGARRTAVGGSWLVEAVRGAQEGMRLKPLVTSSKDATAEHLHIDLPPLPWRWPDGTQSYREPYLALGGWSVWRSAK